MEVEFGVFPNFTTTGSHINKLVWYYDPARHDNFPGIRDWRTRYWRIREWQEIWRTITMNEQITSVQLDLAYWNNTTADDRLIMAALLVGTLPGNTAILNITGDFDTILGDEITAGLITPVLERNRIYALRQRLGEIVRQTDNNESNCLKLFVQELASESTNTNTNLLFTTVKEFMSQTASAWLRSAPATCTT